jgi:hypothetical protein
MEMMTVEEDIEDGDDDGGRRIDPTEWTGEEVMVVNTDKILESLASGTSAVTSRYLNTTGSCNQVGHTTSQINQLVYNIAYPTE